MLDITKLDITINRPRNNWNTKFIASNHKICSCYIIMMFCQYIVHDKSSPIHTLSVVNKEISKKLLRYLSEIVTSNFKAGTAGRGGRGGWFPSGPGGGCDGRAGVHGVFPTIFILYLNDLPSEEWLSMSSISSL